MGVGPRPEGGSRMIRLNVFEVDMDGLKDCAASRVTSSSLHTVAPRPMPHALIFAIDSRRFR